jgi:hypothetical protein
MGLYIFRPIPFMNVSREDRPQEVLPEAIQEAR